MEAKEKDKELKKIKTADEIEVELRAAYEAEKKEAEKEVNEFLKKLAEKGFAVTPAFNLFGQVIIPPLSVVRIPKQEIPK